MEVPERDFGIPKQTATDQPETVREPHNESVTESIGSCAVHAAAFDTATNIHSYAGVQGAELPRTSTKNAEVMRTLATPQLFQQRIVGFFLSGTEGFERMPRKEIINRLCRRSYKTVPGTMKQRIEDELDVLVESGVLTKQLFPKRNEKKRINDTVYFRLSDQTIEQLRTLQQHTQNQLRQEREQQERAWLRNQDEAAPSLEDLLGILPPPQRKPGRRRRGNRHG